MERREASLNTMSFASARVTWLLRPQRAARLARPPRMRAGREADSVLITSTLAREKG